ncbi:hypothetical protein ABIB51_003985 [Arthrobacter sp. UYCu712]
MTTTENGKECPYLSGKRLENCVWRILQGRT